MDFYYFKMYVKSFDTVCIVYVYSQSKLKSTWRTTMGKNKKKNKNKNKKKNKIVSLQIGNLEKFKYLYEKMLGL